MEPFDVAEKIGMSDIFDPSRARSRSARRMGSLCDAALLPGLPASCLAGVSPI